MTTNTNTETRFLLSAERDRYGLGGLDFVAHPVHFTDGEIRNISTDHYRPSALADFVVRARADAPEFGDTYGWAREYRDVFSVDTERAAIMLKHLRALDRGMEKLERELGYAETFASYLARVASLLKIRAFGWKLSDGGRSTYASNEYGWGDATYMSDWVTRQINDYRRVQTS